MAQPITSGLPAPPTDPKSLAAWCAQVKTILDAHSLTAATRSSPTTDGAGNLAGVTGIPSPGPIGFGAASNARFRVLTLLDAVVTPANGRIGAGDAGWIEVGSGGAAAPFQNAWVNTGGIFATAAYRKLPNGMVQLKGFVSNGANGSVAFTLPAGYRPAKQLVIPAANTDASLSAISIANTGTVQLNFAGTPPGIGLCIEFYAEQ